MLHLEGETDPRWAPNAVMHLDEVLIDHAQLEKKAASHALQLLFKYPEHTVLLAPLSALAREELEHFELVLTHLERRGVTYRRLYPAPYAARLRELMRPNDPDRLLDQLLVAAVIEARSCERMRLLAGALEAAEAPIELVRLYKGLLAAEARHHVLYVELAEQLFPVDVVAQRLGQWTRHEASILEFRAHEPRLHG